MKILLLEDKIAQRKFCPKAQFYTSNNVTVLDGGSIFHGDKKKASDRGLRVTAIVKKNIK